MKKLVLCIAFLLFGLTLNAQAWAPANGISDKVVRTMITYNTDTLLAGVDDDGIYISYDNGENWEHFALNGQSIYSLIKKDSIIIAGTEGNDLYKSTLTEPSWLHIFIDNLVIYSLSFHNDTIFACTGGVSGPGIVYYSTDTADTWEQFSTNPPDALAILDIDFNSNGRKFITTPSGAYYTDNQYSWNLTSGFGGTVRTVNYLGNDSLIYGTDDGIFISANNGISGQELEGMLYGSVYHINDTIYVAGTFSGLYYSPQINTSWTSLHLSKTVMSLLNVDGKLIAGTSEGVFLQTGDTAVNIYDNELYSDINIFPNPAKNMLYIESDNFENCNIELFNTKGQLELKNTDTKKINVSTLKPGLYFYRVSSNNNTHVGKIIKD